MSRTGKNLETEIKLAMPSAAKARTALAKAGFRLRKRRSFESNTLYDTAGSDLRSTGRLLRIRTWGNRAFVTFKGPPTRGIHKSREELEAPVADSDVLGEILQRLGFQPTYRYEKYRAEYEVPGQRGTATLDETPIGVFVELEGTPRWIDRTAARMGFGPDDYVTASYATLQIEDCRRRGVELGNMVFQRKA